MHQRPHGKKTSEKLSGESEEIKYLGDPADLRNYVCRGGGICAWLLMHIVVTTCGSIFILAFVMLAVSA